MTRMLLLYQKSKAAVQLSYMIVQEAGYVSYASSRPLQDHINWVIGNAQAVVTAVGKPAERASLCGCGLHA